MGFDYAAKIRALLAKADGEEALGNDGAGAEFRAKAQEWMNRYKIAEEAALAEDPTAAEPTFVKVTYKPRSEEVSSFYIGLVTILAQHTEVEWHLDYLSDSSWQVTVVGYEGDVRYFEFLWTSAFLMFTTKIDPHWDEAQSTEINIFNLRQAGIKRKEIADRAWGNGAGDLAQNRSKVQRMYLAEARRQGVSATATGLGFQAKDYRRAYASEFNSALESRLRRARDAANASGGVVVLAGRKDRVREAFYTMFPSERPRSTVSREYVDPTLNCDRCQALRRKELTKPEDLQRNPSAITCQGHAYMRPRAWTEADERRWQNKHNGPSARAGRSSGRQAAEGVILRGTASPTAKRVEGSNQALEG
jgi:hypothetical protein